LATIATKGKGGVGGPWPYTSLVLATCDHDISPLLLVSDLADHTRNLRQNPRVSLLYDGTGGLDDPLSGPRVTLQGEAEQIDKGPLLDRYLRRHPSAEVYAGFTDFHLFRVRPVRAHIVAGFGRIDWIEAGELMLAADRCNTLAADETTALAHWNEKHAELFDAFARGLLRMRGKGWRAVGLDPEGIDIRRGGTLARIEFRAPVESAEAALAGLHQRIGMC
jgi:putative heme iron utilization protein